MTQPSIPADKMIGLGWSSKQSIVCSHKVQFACICISMCVYASVFAWEQIQKLSKSDWPHADNPWRKERSQSLYESRLYYPHGWQTLAITHNIKLCVGFFFFLKHSMCKKYCGLHTQKMPLGGLRVCVWPADILCLDCGLFKNVISFFIQHLKIRLHIKISISNLSWKLRKIWKLWAVLTGQGAEPKTDSPILARTHDLHSLHR